MKITRSAEMPWEKALQQGNYSQQRKPLSTDAIGAGLWELAPGKKSFPLHLHHVTHEAMFVVSGHAKVRTTEGETKVGPGDYVSFPPGGLAHQLINDGAEPFVYLGLSAARDVDIVEYPDTAKISLRTGGVPPAAKRHIFKVKDQVEYFADDQDAVDATK